MIDTAIHGRSQPYCLACGAGDLTACYSQGHVPVHSVLSLSNREEAVGIDCGDIILSVCRRCGFIANLAFRPELLAYSVQYEETQGFSEVFTAFHRRLAQDLVERFKLHNKDILEIGCGKGEFLKLLCELGGNRGVGFDPAFVPERLEISDLEIRIVREYFSAKYLEYNADFICCKMTLEHIPDVAQFLDLLRQSAANRPGSLLFIQVPDMERILAEGAFWDIYYEHCSYFSAVSLGCLLRASGFEVLDIHRDYDGQYLMAEARIALADRRSDMEPAEEMVRYFPLVDGFADRSQQRLSFWRERLIRDEAVGRKTVLWGGGSKAVAFLSALDIGTAIRHVVDINPYRQGTFIAGTGQEIVAPEMLLQLRPDLVVVMNPVYLDEVRRNLAELGLSPRCETPLSCG